MPFFESAARVSLESSVTIFVMTAINGHDVFAGIMVVVTSKINFELSAHVPACASLLKIFRLASCKFSNLTSFCNNLVLAETHAVPRRTGRIAAVDASLRVRVGSCGTPARFDNIPVDGTPGEPSSALERFIVHASASVWVRTARELGEVKDFAKGVQHHGPDTVLSLPLRTVFVVDSNGNDWHTRTEYPARSHLAAPETLVTIVAGGSRTHTVRGQHAKG